MDIVTGDVEIIVPDIFFLEVLTAFLTKPALSLDRYHKYKRKPFKDEYEDSLP